MQVKDTVIIQREVMHEYDEKVRALVLLSLLMLIAPSRKIQFVNPRVHPVMRDAAVMTHQAEMVHAHETHHRYTRH